MCYSLIFLLSIWNPYSPFCLSFNYTNLSSLLLQKRCPYILKEPKHSCSLGDGWAVQLWLPMNLTGGKTWQKIYMLTFLFFVFSNKFTLLIYSRIKACLERIKLKSCLVLFLFFFSFNKQHFFSFFRTFVFFLQFNFN